MTVVIGLPTPDWWPDEMDDADLINLARNFLAEFNGRYVNWVGTGKSASLDFRFETLEEAERAREEWMRFIFESGILP